MNPFCIFLRMVLLGERTTRSNSKQVTNQYVEFILGFCEKSFCVDLEGLVDLKKHHVSMKQLVYTEVLTSVNFLALLSHKSWLAQKSMLLHITDFMKFWDALSYRLTVAPLVQHHSVDTYKAIINFSHLCPAVVSYIINTVSFRSRSITC